MVAGEAGRVGCDGVDGRLEEHLFTLRQAYETLVFVQERIASFDIQIRAMFAKLAQESDKPDPPDPPQDPKMSKSEKNKLKKDAAGKRDLAKLAGFDMTRIEGIDYMTAAGIIAELGTDLFAFPDERKFVSYIGLKPPLSAKNSTSLADANACYAA